MESDMAEDPRKALERLIRERGEDYLSLSRLLGRNAAYIQQYIKRGTPRRLAEDDRRRLARYFSVDEEVLGGPPSRSPIDGFVTVPRLDVDASAGPGALDSAERSVGSMAFDPAWLRRLGVSDSARLSMIRVEGDSMVPTLSEGDEILVDGGDRAGRFRDGLYVLRLDEALVVKRVARGSGGRLSVLSDNPAFPGRPDCDPSEIDIVGRVVWVGRRLG
jgi:phage repressor protein C with HTH and peptisase S24 domain